MVQLHAGRRVDAQRRVVEIVRPSAAVGERPGRLGSGAGRVVAGRVGPRDEQRFGIAAPERVAQLVEERSAQRRFPVVARQRRFGQQDELHPVGHLGEQIDDVALLPRGVAVELVVAIHVGLHDAHRRRPRRCERRVALPLEEPLLAPERQREEQRHDDRRRCRDPPPRVAALAPRLEDQDVADQHPERAAEDARVFVPLHGPHVVRESVAQHEPRPREVARRVPVLGRDPRRDQRRMGERPRRTLRDGMVGHEGEHVEERRGERRRDRPHGRGIPDPPHRSRVPQHERERGPAEHAPPAATRRRLHGADPQQGHEGREQGESRTRKPARSEQNDRQNDRCEFTEHAKSFYRDKSSQSPAYFKTDRAIFAPHRPPGLSAPRRIPPPRETAGRTSAPARPAKQTPPQSSRPRRPHAPGPSAGRNHGSRTPDSPKKSYLCPYTRKPTLP